MGTSRDMTNESGPNPKYKGGRVATIHTRGNNGREKVDVGAHLSEKKQQGEVDAFP